MSGREPAVSPAETRAEMAAEPPARSPAETPAETAAESAAQADAQAEAEAEVPVADQEARHPLDDPRMPWTGRPRAADIACWAGITLSGLYYLLLLPFRAALVGTHPVVSVLLNGSTESIVAAAAFARVGHGTLVVVLLASIVGLMLFDPLYWWAGRLWGERFILLLSGRRKRGPKYMARVQRWGQKFTWPVIMVSRFLPIPNAIIYVIAGWAGMRLATFLILDLIGSLLWAGMLAGLGYALGHHAVVVAQAISHYGLWFTVAIVVLIVASQVRSGRAAKREAAGHRADGPAGPGAAAGLAEAFEPSGAAAATEIVEAAGAPEPGASDRDER